LLCHFNFLFFIATICGEIKIFNDYCFNSNSSEARIIENIGKPSWDLANRVKRPIIGIGIDYLTFASVLNE